MPMMSWRSSTADANSTTVCAELVEAPSFATSEGRTALRQAQGERNRKNARKLEPPQKFSMRRQFGELFCDAAAQRLKARGEFGVGQAVGDRVPALRANPLPGPHRIPVRRRSEERRVGKEWVRPFRSRWATYP